MRRSEVRSMRVGARRAKQVKPQQVARSGTRASRRVYAPVVYMAGRGVVTGRW